MFTIQIVLISTDTIYTDLCFAGKSRLPATVPVVVAQVLFGTILRWTQVGVKFLVVSANNNCYSRNTSAMRERLKRKHVYVNLTKSEWCK